MYHATTAANAESIVRNGFRMPTDSEGPERGLKAGAAVYFGFNAEYCVHEAVNTLEEQREEQGGNSIG